MTLKYQYSTCLAFMHIFSVIEQDDGEVVDWEIFKAHEVPLVTEIAQ